MDWLADNYYQRVHPFTLLVGPASALLLAVALLFSGCASSAQDAAKPTSRPTIQIRELPPVGVEESRAAISSFEASGTGPRFARRVTIPGECGGLGYRSLREAVQNADAIVVGRVTSVEFLFDGETQQLAQLQVEEVIRGNPNQAYVLNITGGPREVDGELVLTQHPTNPLVLPGDRGVFLLQRMSLTAAFVPQGYTGQLRLGSGGSIETVLGNPFASEIARSDEKSLLKTIRKLAGG